MLQTRAGRGPGGPYQPWIQDCAWPSRSIYQPTTFGTGVLIPQLLRVWMMPDWSWTLCGACPWLMTALSSKVTLSAWVSDKYKCSDSFASVKATLYHHPGFWSSEASVVTLLQPHFSLSYPLSFMSFMGVGPESAPQNTSVYWPPSQDLPPGETDLHTMLCVLSSNQIHMMIL